MQILCFTLFLTEMNVQHILKKTANNSLMIALAGLKWVVHLQLISEKKRFENGLNFL